MAYNYTDIMLAQDERISIEQAQATAELEAARLNEDYPGTLAASQRILELDVQRSALAQRAQQFAASQRAQPQGNKYGLTDEEVEVAKASHGAGTDEERIAEYARNKQRYQHMRATGEYRDDQGTVRR